MRGEEAEGVGEEGWLRGEGEWDGECQRSCVHVRLLNPGQVHPAPSALRPRPSFHPQVEVMSEAPSAAAAARRAAAQSTPAPEPPPSLGAHLVLLLNSLSLIGWTVVGATVGARLRGVRLPALLPLFPELELGDGASVWSAGVLGERSIYLFCHVKLPAHSGIVGQLKKLGRCEIARNTIIARLGEGNCWRRQHQKRESVERAG